MADHPQRWALAGQIVSTPAHARRILRAALTQKRRWIVRQAISVIRHLEKEPRHG